MNNSAPAQSDHVNMETLNMLQEVMEDGFVNLLETFISDSKVRLGDLRTALAANDADGVRRAAHSLKGSSGNLGANRMADLCLRVENRGKEGQLDGLDAELSSIEAEYEQVTALMQKMLH